MKEILCISSNCTVWSTEHPGSIHREVECTSGGVQSFVPRSVHQREVYSTASWTSRDCTSQGGTRCTVLRAVLPESVHHWEVCVHHWEVCNTESCTSKECTQTGVYTFSAVQLHMVYTLLLYKVMYTLPELLHVCSQYYTPSRVVHSLDLQFSVLYTSQGCMLPDVPRFFYLQGGALPRSTWRYN